MISPMQILTVDFKKYCTLAFFAAMTLTHSFITKGNDYDNVGRRIPATLLFLTLPVQIYQTSCTSCTGGQQGIIYHYMSILVGGYFFASMVNMLTTTAAEKVNEHWDFVDPTICDANPMGCMTAPKCHLHSDFFALVGKYGNHGLVFFSIPILNCVYGFPEALGVFLTWFNIIAFLLIPWLLLMPFKKVRCVACFFLYFIIGFDYILAGNDQFVQGGYMPESLLVPIAATSVLFYLSLVVPDFLIITAPWFYGVFFPSMSCETITGTLQNIYGTPEPEPVIKVVETRRPKVMMTSRGGV
jgi:hypothetical protein